MTHAKKILQNSNSLNLAFENLESLAEKRQTRGMTHQKGSESPKGGKKSA